MNDLSLVYLYLPTTGSECDDPLAVRAFEAAGYNPQQVIKTDSMERMVEMLPHHSTLIVYSLGCCPTFDELLDLLGRLHHKGIVLRSLKEPWVNEVLLGYAYSLNKLRLMLTEIR